MKTGFCGNQFIWRILYAKRFPHVTEVEHEDILVFDKGIDIPRVNVKEDEMKDE